MSVKKKDLLMRSLLYFQETIRNGKITLTAQKNGIKISNLSKMLKDLEEELHVQLLHRSRDGVRPTTAGKQIYNMTLRVEEKLRLFESILSRREDEFKVIRVYIAIILLLLLLTVSQVCAQAHMVIKEPTYKI